MINIFFKCLYILGSEEKKKLFTLQLLMVAVAIVDAIGIVSIMPFVSMLGNENEINKNVYIKTLYDYALNFGVSDYSGFLILFGIIVMLILSIGIALKSFVTYLQYKFVYNQEFNIGSRMFKSYLDREFLFFVNRGTSVLSKNIITELKVVINQVYMPALNLISQSVVALSISIVLLLIDFWTTLFITLIITSIYFLIYHTIKNKLSVLGRKRFASNENRFRIVNECFKCIKEIKITNSIDFFTKKYNQASKDYAIAETEANLLSQLPRFLLEFLIFIGLLLFVLYLLVTEQSLTFYIPLISVYVFAGYRLMPSIQHIYGCISVLKYSKNSLDKIYQELKNIEEFAGAESVSKINNLCAVEDINFKNINFSYNKKNKKALIDINMSIPRYSHIGIVGSSGSGKTTLLNILTGLCKHDSGEILINGRAFDLAYNKQWYEKVGYVPQDSFLLDASIALNVALGAEESEVDMSMVKDVCEKVGLSSFIETEMEEGYNTNIGENGSRLSGGQRQRLSIARALYKSPELLIFDEATSSLDKNSESLIVEVIESLKNTITIISVAHSSGALVNCDYLYTMKNGKLVINEK